MPPKKPKKKSPPKKKHQAKKTKNELRDEELDNVSGGARVGAGGVAITGVNLKKDKQRRRVLVHSEAGSLGSAFSLTGLVPH
jgi:hypothetical protein